MKVCLISHSYFQKGYLSVLTSLAAHRGVELALITPESYQHPLDGTSMPFSLTDSSYRTYPLRIHFPRRQGTFIYHWGELSRAIDEVSPDVILHEQEVYALGAAQVAAVAAKKRIPLSMFVWENVHRQLAPPRRKIVQYVCQNCAGIMAGSELAVEVHRAFGFQGPMPIIPQMGVASVSKKPLFGRRHPDCVQICFAGRLIPSKGVDSLLKAVSALVCKGLKIRFKIAGTGPELDLLKNLVAELKIGENVEFLGSVPMNEVSDLLSKSDALLLPSRKTSTWEEQFGRILVEAMAEGTLAAGTKTGAIPEVIGSEELVFEEDDVEGMVKLINRISSDESFVIEHQEKLWERARDNYTNGVLTEKKVTFLASLL